MYHSRWRGRDRTCPPDQVANKKDSLVDLTPVSEAPAEHVRVGWDPWVPHQAVPLIWERVRDAEPCDDI